MLLRLGADLVVHEELESGLEVPERVLDHLGGGHEDVRAYVDDALTAARGERAGGPRSERTGGGSGTPPTPTP